MPAEPSHVRPNVRAAARTGEYRGRRRAADQPAAQPASQYRGRHAAPKAQHSRAAGAVMAVGIVGVAGVLAQALPGQSGQSAQAASRNADGSASTATTQGDSTSHQAASAFAPSRDVVSAVPAPLLPAPLRMTAVSRAKERAQMPGCHEKDITLDYANGQIPGDELCTLPWAKKHRLRADAAIALAKLDVAYNDEFDTDLCITDSYRSLASQISVAARKPGLAARPGYSEHGWGLAVDLCDGGDVAGTPEHDWLIKNAPKFGWDNPEWARPGGSRPEAWHWEYVAGETAQQQ